MDFIGWILLAIAVILEIGLLSICDHLKAIRRILERIEDNK